MIRIPPKQPASMVGATDHAAEQTAYVGVIFVISALVVVGGGYLIYDAYKGAKR